MTGIIALLSGGAIVFGGLAYWLAKGAAQVLRRWSLDHGGTTVPGHLINRVPIRVSDHVRMMRQLREDHAKIHAD